ncbi:ankyrin repeat-containing domain protein [Russula brevipes]|nr:ankyrin repeat-containing domain protein [Russula brevipes]
MRRFYPQQVNASGGRLVTPLVAALAGEHFRTADLLRHNGADPNVRGHFQRAPLHAAAYYGHLEVIRKLIEYEADINARDVDDETPLYTASITIHPEYPSAVRLLLGHGADVNARTKDGSTPLLMASRQEALEGVRLLLEHGADVGVEDNMGRTPFRVAGGNPEIMELLSEHGAEGLQSTVEFNTLVRQHVLHPGVEALEAVRGRDN